jgi:integrase
LRWHDIDLARGKITVGRSKIDAGVRVVGVLPVLQDELTAHRATVQHAGPDDLVFPRRAAAAATRSASGRSLTAAMGHHWALIDPPKGLTTFPRKRPETTKTPRMQGLPTMGAAGFEPATSRV